MTRERKVHIWKRWRRKGYTDWDTWCGRMLTRPESEPSASWGNRGQTEKATCLHCLQRFKSFQDWLSKDAKRQGGAADARLKSLRHGSES